MKPQEKEEIRNMPEGYRPLGAGKIWLYRLIFLIPIAGFFIMVCFAFDMKNYARRQFAMHHFMLLLLVVCVWFILFVIRLTTGFSVLSCLLN